MNPSIKTEKLSRDLEEVAGKLFDEVRRDNGTFSTGSCLVNGKKLLLINTRQSADERIASLAREITRMGIDKVYLKPAVREEVERWASESHTPPLADETEA